MEEVEIESHILQSLTKATAQLESSPAASQTPVCTLRLLKIAAIPVPIPSAVKMGGLGLLAYREAGGKFKCWGAMIERNQCSACTFSSVCFAEEEIQPQDVQGGTEADGGAPGGV